MINGRAQFQALMGVLFLAAVAGGAGPAATGPADLSIDAVLDRQGDRAAEWRPEWGDRVERLHAAGGLEADQWQRYQRQVVGFRLRVRPAVRQSDPVPAEMELLPARQGSHPDRTRPLQVWATPVADATVRADGLAGPRALRGWAADGSETLFFHLRLTAGLDGHVAVGRHSLAVRFHYAVARAWGDDAPAEAEGEVTLPAELSVLPDAADSVGPADAAFMDAIHARVWFGGNPGSGLGHIYVIPRIDGPAAGSYQFQAFARTGAVERPLGSFRSVKGGGMTGAHDVDLAGLKLTEMTPVLRCSPADARDTVDQTMYLPQDVVLRWPISLYR